jgi:arginine decarboxylase
VVLLVTTPSSVSLQQKSLKVAPPLSLLTLSHTRSFCSVVKKLKAESLLESLQLLHFHIGSQISRISVVKEALKEAAQFFVGLAKMGCNMTYLDVGGGLGIDYDGSKTSFHASMNYTISEYANDVIVAIQKICDKNNVPHPVIVSESGRAVASHQTVLVLSALAVTKPMLTKNGKDTPKLEEPDKNDHTLVKQLHEMVISINNNNLQESYHDATQLKVCFRLFLSSVPVSFFF